MLVRVPASSANLGPGFDTLGMALSLHAEVGLGAAPDGARAADEHHPAMVAFRRNGGEGPLWVRSPIPVGRGMGFSGAVRVGGAVAAHAQQHGTDPEALADAMPALLRLATELEGHADNVAASLYGGVVATAGGRAVRVPLSFDPAMVMWVPRTALLVAAILRLVAAQPGRKVLVLSDRKAQLRDVREGVAAGGVSAGFYWGGMKPDALAASERCQVMLATFAYASEGMDVPGLDALFLASPKSDIEQSCGRILRQKAEDRERTPLIVDFVDDFSLFARQGAKRRAFYRKHQYVVRQGLPALDRFLQGGGEGGEGGDGDEDDSDGEEGGGGAAVECAFRDDDGDGGGGGA